MSENPTPEHCLRLTTIAASLTSFVLAAYAFLLNQKSDFGKGFFAMLIYLGLLASLTSIFAYMFKSHRTAFFYVSLILVICAFIMLVPIVLIFYFI
jgi:hypothetical protein